MYSLLYRTVHLTVQEAESHPAWMTEVCTNIPENCVNNQGHGLTPTCIGLTDIL